jgi:hypothetical protein
MLYTPTPSTRQGTRIRLYPTPHAAQAHAEDGRAIHAVAVNFDEINSCLTPVDKVLAGVDAAWRASVELHEDGSVTTQGPLPAHLFVN